MSRVVVNIHGAFYVNLADNKHKHKHKHSHIEAGISELEMCIDHGNKSNAEK